MLVYFAGPLFSEAEKRFNAALTDPRAAFVGSKLNPMVGVPLEFVAASEKELLDALAVQV